MALASQARRAGAEPDAVVADLQLHHGFGCGIATRPHRHLRGAGMLQHIGEGLQQNALDLQHLVRRELAQCRQFGHIPDHLDAGGLQPRLQAVAQRRQHRDQVVVRRLQRIDRHAHLIQRVLDLLLKLNRVGPGPGHHVEEADQLRADAVVDFPHDALTFGQHRLLVVLFAQGVERSMQLPLAFVDTVRKIGVQRVVVRHRTAVALGKQAAHDEHKGKHGVLR